MATHRKSHKNHEVNPQVITKTESAWLFVRLFLTWTKKWLAASAGHRLKPRPTCRRYLYILHHPEYGCALSIDALQRTPAEEFSIRRFSYVTVEVGLACIHQHQWQNESGTRKSANSKCAMRRAFCSENNGLHVRQRMRYSETGRREYVAETSSSRETSW